MTYQITEADQKIINSTVDSLTENLHKFELKSMLEVFTDTEWSREIRKTANVDLFPPQIEEVKIEIANLIHNNFI